jgi:hypothetical protein
LAIFLLHILSHYDPETMDEGVLEYTNGGLDCIGTGPGAIQPLFLHWGDLGQANRAADMALGNLRGLLASGTYLTVRTAPSMIWMALSWPIWLHLLGRNDDAAAFTREINVVAGEADQFWQKLRELSPAVMLPRGADSTNFTYSEEQMSLIC